MFFGDVSDMFPCALVLLVSVSGGGGFLEIGGLPR
jgi:hypothetical protein